MNKTDILAKKIKHGANIKDHIAEYTGDNDFVAVASWFRRLFKRLFLDNNGAMTRKFVGHFTNVTDTKATLHTLQGVQAAILRKDITEAGLM